MPTLSSLGNSSGRKQLQHHGVCPSSARQELNRPNISETVIRSANRTHAMHRNPSDTEPARPGSQLEAGFSSRLHAELRERLLALPYRAFLQTVIHLLGAQGYGRVVPAGRSGFKGRNRAGGWDLEAQDRIDGETFRCIVQAKQIGARAIYQRQVDELRGAALRAGADEALLVTLSTFSPPARLAVLAGAWLSPVRLVDGQGLVEQMVEHQVGIRLDGRQWAVNRLYFESLEKRFGERQSEEGSSGTKQSQEQQSAGNSAPSTHPNSARQETVAVRKLSAATAAVPPAGRGHSTLAICHSEEPGTTVRVTVTLVRCNKNAQGSDGCFNGGPDAGGRKDAGCSGARM
jgi:hypothetical protein